MRPAPCSTRIVGISSPDHFLSRGACAVEHPLYWAERLHELELLAFAAFAVDDPPAVRLACGDGVAVRVDRRRAPFFLRSHRDDAVGSDLRHPTSRSLRFE